MSRTGRISIMATDHNLQLRRAILPMLKAEPLIASLTGGRVYSEQPPTLPAFPFIRYGFSTGLATEWSCAQGSDNQVTINVFSKSPGTDECARLCKAVARAMDGKTRQLEADPDTGESATAIDMTHIGTDIIRDGDDAQAHNGIVRVAVTVADDF